MANDVEIRVQVKGAAAAAAQLGRLGVGAAIIGWAPVAAVALADLAGAALLIPGAVGAAAAAFSTFQVAVGGVGAALGAMSSKAAGGGSAVASSGRAIRDALDAVSDAKRRQTQVMEDSNRDIERAERDVARAISDAAADVTRAKEEQARAEEDVAERVADALERQEEAQESLNDARVDAARALDDLRDKVAGYALDEDGARLRVLAAAAAQRKAAADSSSTNLDRAQAAHNVREAEERLANVQKNRARDTAKLAEEEAKGVEGSDLVVAAQKRLQDATDAATEAREDGAERMADAAARVAEAEEQGAERVAAARESLADTERSAARDRAEAAEAVADAQQRLDDAYEDAAKGAGGAAGGADAYAEALAKLSPNARAFVETVKELTPAWQEMQKEVQNEFFAGFADEVRELSDIYLPVLRDGMVGVAGAMNSMALYASGALMDPAVVQAVADIFAYTKQTIDNARPALGDFIAGFIQLAAIGAEYLPAFGSWLADIAARFREWVETNPDGIRDFIDRALEGFGQLWGILTNVGDTVANLFGGLDGGESEGFLASLEEMTQALADFTADETVQAVLGFIGEALRAIIETAPFWGPVAAGIWLVNAAMAANPATLIAVAIVALIAVFKLLWDNCDGFRVFWTLTWNQTVAVFTAAKNAIVAGWEWLKNAATSTAQWIADRWNLVKAKLQEFAGWVSSTGARMWDGITAGARSMANGVIGHLNFLIRGANVLIRGFNTLNPFGQIPYIPQIGYFAKGGIASGMAIVGEQGPELVRLGAGSQVHTAPDTRRMLAAAQPSAAAGGALELRVAAGADSALASLLMRLVREGELQLVPAA